MTHPQPRTRFNSPRLIRMLSALGGPECGADAAESVSFAERLSRWIALTDAIGLSRALASAVREPAPAAGAQDMAAALRGLQAQRSRLRESLTAVEIGNGALPRGRVRLPAAPAGASGIEGVDFTPYRHFYLAQQRDLEANVGLLRAAARDALAGVPSAARTLREIDGALQAALAERERSLLAGIPRLLERRFEALRAAAAASPAANDAATWMRPGGWLATFRGELLAVLEAELELRLQPVSGLMETLEQGISADAAFAALSPHTMATHNEQ